MSTPRSLLDFLHTKYKKKNSRSEYWTPFDTNSFIPLMPLCVEELKKQLTKKPKTLEQEKKMTHRVEITLCRGHNIWKLKSWLPPKTELGEVLAEIGLSLAQQQQNLICDFHNESDIETFWKGNRNSQYHNYCISPKQP